MDPLGRAHDIRHANFIEIALEVVVVVPASHVKASWRANVERPSLFGVGAVEFSIDVQLGLPFAIGMHNVGPLAKRYLSGTFDVPTRKVAIHAQMRRTSKLHDSFPLACSFPQPMSVALGRSARNHNSVLWEFAPIG